MANVRAGHEPKEASTSSGYCEPPTCAAPVKWRPPTSLILATCFLSLLLSPHSSCCWPLRRKEVSGPAAAGWIAGLPIAFAVTLFAMARTEGATTAGRVAASAAGHVSAQVAFGLIFGAALVRWGLTAAGIAGLLGYVTASVTLAQMPQYAATALGVAALAAGAALMPRQPSRTRRPGKPSTAIVVCLSAAVAVLGATLASQAAGPVLGGAVAAFPTTSATLAVTIAAQGKRDDAANVAFGLVRSLPCFLVLPSSSLQPPRI